MWTSGQGEREGNGQQIVVDIFDRLKFCVRLLGGAEHVRMFAAIAINVANIFEIFDPLIQAQQVKIGSRDEIDRVFISMKEPAYFGNVSENSSHVYGPFQLVGDCERCFGFTRFNASSVNTRSPRSGRYP